MKTAALRSLLVGIALAFVAIAPQVARADAVCSPQMQGFPALFPDIVVGTGGTLTFTQSGVLTQFQQVQQEYCQAQNIAQSLQTGSAGFSQWSNAAQQLYSMGTSSSPGGFANNLAASVFNEQSDANQNLANQELALQNPLGQTSALQTNGAMMGAAVDELQKQTAMQAQAQLQGVAATIQGAQAVGQDLDLNGDPTTGWSF